MENYEPLDPIGSGSFGVIRKVRRKTDGKILARKEITYSKMTEKEKRQLVAEVNILRELRHPNIVRYLERVVDRNSGTIFIIMEYCEGGDLAAIIRKCKKESKRIPEDIIWSLFTQLVLALHECHNGSKNGERPAILHRDIKPDNVFLDANNNIKLGDFGLSRIIGHPETDFAQTYVGTPFYMSPELVTESCYNTKSDIWALGCLIYELCALEPPFQSKTQEGLALKIRRGVVPQLPSMYSAELSRVIRYLLQTEHEKRPGTAELLALDRIRLCVREREQKALEQELKIKEAELNSREQKLQKLTEDLQKREEAVAQVEQRLKKKEEVLRMREQQLEQELASRTAVKRNESTKYPDLGNKFESLLISAEQQTFESTSIQFITPIPLSKRTSRNDEVGGLVGGLIGSEGDEPSTPFERKMRTSP